MNISYRDKIDLIEKYVDQEMVFNHCGFNTAIKNPKNPYRSDRHTGSCNWKWYRNKLYFFDWTYPFENGTKKSITIYGAVMLARPNLSSFREAVDFIYDTYVSNINKDITIMNDQAENIVKKNKLLEEEFESSYTINILKQSSWGTINYYTRYGLNPSILNKENVLNIQKYQVIKNLGKPNEKDVTGVFPTIEDAQGLMIAYKYDNKYKLYFPFLKKGLKKPRFFGNINAKKTIEGYKQAYKPSNKKMICLGSKKDYMVARYVLKFKADIFATQNEGTQLPFLFHEKIIETYPIRWLLYDNDANGLRLAQKVMQEDNYTGMIILPEYFNSEKKLLKDPSDLQEYFKSDTMKIIQQSKFISNEYKNTNTNKPALETW